MASNAYALGQYEDEGSTTLLGIWDGDQWLDYAADATVIDDAQVFSKAQNPVESMRTLESALQTRYPDMDVRLVGVNVTVALGTLP